MGKHGKMKVPHKEATSWESMATETNIEMKKKPLNDQVKDNGDANDRVEPMLVQDEVKQKKGKKEKREKTEKKEEGDMEKLEEHVENQKEKGKLTNGQKVKVVNDTNVNRKVGNDSGKKTSSALEKRREQRRMRRQNQKYANTICFKCREKGHPVNACPYADNQVAGHCYHCGSNNHTTKNCAKKFLNFKFAECFVCGEVGHLSSKCPKNANGLYPNGGGCKYCGSVEHLARDCKPASQEQGKITIGKIRENASADDDDVFDALKQIHQDKRPMGDQPKAKANQPAKIVQF